MAHKGTFEPGRDLWHRMSLVFLGWGVLGRGETQEEYKEGDHEVGREAAHGVGKY
jgi:hypothetical protein